ncbi:50S ribosomal protein L18 [Candidatus Uhrbacteria bacterium]|nr:50S ribosomal protein L18 [Candidatus Uhrbacteria bacterium]
MQESITRIKVKAGKRARRVRAKIRGESGRPRLSVHVTNKHMYAQCVDDAVQQTLVAVSDAILGPPAAKHIKVEAARALGRKFAELALQKGIAQVVFDRGSKTYHGRVRSFAEGAREGGLKF